MLLLRNLKTKKLYFTLARTFSNDTIFSLSSGAGKCGVAIIRVSGSQARNAIESLTRNTVSNNKELIEHSKQGGCIKPRFAHLRNFYHPSTNELIDRGLLLWFPGPNSFTGEDCCEFQVHGGPAIVSAVYSALNTLKSVRPANPGEFTKRAFWSNKLDLTEVEGLAELIHAETEVQRKQALLQANGALSKLYNQWRSKILKLIAHVEAYIDFAEDEDIEPDTLIRVHRAVHELIREIEIFLKDARQGQMRQYGVKLVILGEPNVGKSSFMNHICREPISIVANVAGTTRDIIEKPFNIAGYPVLIADTAGLRSHTNDPIESEGMSRATNYAKTADFVILMIDAQKLQAYQNDINRYKRDYLKEIGLNESDPILEKKTILVVNKIDLMEKDGKLDKMDATNGSSDEIVWISCKEDTGISKAMEIIEKNLTELCGIPSAANPQLTNERHRLLMIKCLENLNNFMNEFSDENALVNPDIDLAITAEYLREAIRCIGRITGAINTEEILDVIFRDFCIGK